MPRKHYKPEEIIDKLREAELLAAQSHMSKEVARQITVSVQPYYRWRREYDGMDKSQRWEEALGGGAWDRSWLQPRVSAAYHWLSVCSGWPVGGMLVNVRQRLPTRKLHPRPCKVASWLFCLRRCGLLGRVGSVCTHHQLGVSVVDRHP